MRKVVCYNEPLSLLIRRPGPVINIARPFTQTTPFPHSVQEGYSEMDLIDSRRHPVRADDILTVQTTLRLCEQGSVEHAADSSPKLPARSFLDGWDALDTQCPIPMW